VLSLDRTAALEGLRLGIEPTEGIVDTEGGGVTELELGGRREGR